MITDLKKSIMYFCPICGKMKCFDINVFMFSGKKPVILSCDCNKTFLTINSGKKGKYSIISPCVACNEPHSYEIGMKTLWNARIICFACPFLDVESFYTGEKDQLIEVKEKYKNQIDFLKEDLEFEDYFVDNPIVSEVSDAIEKLIKKGNAKCECGSKRILQQVYFDRVELFCSSCFSFKVFDAVSENDAIDAWNIKKINIKGYGGASTNNT